VQLTYRLGPPDNCCRFFATTFPNRRRHQHKPQPRSRGNCEEQSDGHQRSNSDQLRNSHRRKVSTGPHRT
jgi:hypothetical protein